MSITKLGLLMREKGSSCARLRALGIYLCWGVEH
jgi:hypothetical protein